MCLECRRPSVACYCARLKAFDPGFDLALLIHPREARNPVGTARMLHRFTLGSQIFQGTGKELSRDVKLQSWLKSHQGKTWVLYPSSDAVWVNPQSDAPFSREARAGILIIDGTWSQARGLMRDCLPLRGLPTLAFHPRAPSQYAIREQPQELCMSSLEATHELCQMLNLHQSPGPGPMLEEFLHMVDFQLKSENGSLPPSVSSTQSSAVKKPQ